VLTSPPAGFGILARSCAPQLCRNSFQLPVVDCIEGCHPVQLVFRYKEIRVLHSEWPKNSLAQEFIEPLFRHEFYDSAQNVNADIAVIPLCAGLEEEAELCSAPDQLGKRIRSRRRSGSFAARGSPAETLQPDRYMVALRIGSFFSRSW
jgi:hypothetical protein